MDPQAVERAALCKYSYFLYSSYNYEGIIVSYQVLFYNECGLFPKSLVQSKLQQQWVLFNYNPKHFE